jgi:hypothetical protein
MLQLNRVLVSENLKLTVLSFLASSSVFSLRNTIQSSFRTYQDQLVGLRSLERILKLFTDKYSADGTKFTASNQSQVEATAANLAIHLRQSLLNSYELIENLTMEDLKTKKFRLCKKSFEFAKIYLDLLEASFDKKGGKDQSAPRNEVENGAERSVDSKLSEATPVLLAPLAEPPVDEIFEAEVHESEEEAERNGDLERDEFVLKEKEAAMLNKNLFYELKYALKAKSNEWSQREKEVLKKRGLDENNNTDLGEREHLLENDVLKYRARLNPRNRRPRNTEAQDLDLMQREKQRKYVYERKEEEKVVKVETGASHFSQGLMAEFMRKRNTVMSIDEEVIGGGGSQSE